MSTGFLGFWTSLTAVGKAAPPWPTEPAARMALIICSGVYLSRTKSLVSSFQGSGCGCCWSAEITTERTLRPVGCRRGSTAITAPLTGL